MLGVHGARIATCDLVHVRSCREEVGSQEYVIINVLFQVIARGKRRLRGLYMAQMVIPGCNNSIRTIGPSARTNAGNLGNTLLDTMKRLYSVRTHELFP